MTAPTTDPRAAGRLGRWALLVAALAVVLLLVYRWMLGGGGDLPPGEVARTFSGVRPLVLVAFFAATVAASTMAGVSLSERGRPRAAAVTALVLAVGALVVWVAVL